MMRSLGDQEQILSSLYNVGKSKAVGYLPLRTITNFLKLDVEKIQLELQERGLKTKLYKANETCINSGAIYTFCESQVNIIIADHQTAINDHLCALCAVAVVDFLAKNWLPEDHPLMGLVHELFGESSEIGKLT